ncbi:sigma-70 family RNA polymerase sigma factor [Sphingomonas sabuli]|uniref:Sigma-70 family RNA polymerase sigma factor n=1 Tax=Sphingomonas sabuli TaxID=2764186 RepID=A0A7G9L4A4_9SPHN|nr:sigma-70 family RNA polymerase sigma factor [Sphingomonas sabuli]QNM83453.1 sigma-70 family RNA polymerase sigma factor [Sphingomonas sabuli]
MTGGTTSQDRRYEALAATYGPMIARLARGYERDPEKARDLVQTIHVELWRSLASFDGQCSDKSWVHRIAHNVGVSHMIREARTNHGQWVGLDDVELAGPQDAEVELDRAQRQQRMLALVHRLKPADRQVVLLHLEDLSAAEIADVLGMAPGTVSVRLHRAKAVLRTRIGE